MAKLSDIGEREAIALLSRIFDRGQPIGLGHDCGVVEWGEDYLVITTDVVNPRTHIPEGARADQVGWYVVAVNLSDVAAAGARPLGFVAALSLPPSTDVDFLKGLAQGMEACAREFGIGEVLVELGDLRSEQQALVNDRARGERRKVEKAFLPQVRSGDRRFGLLAHYVEFAFERVLLHARLRPGRPPGRGRRRARSARPGCRHRRSRRWPAR